jgi:pyridinium-3,5-bisthiocarboxylic acid mononucleotide nickel chelatase
VDTGAEDMAGRANVVRVVVGEPAASDHSYATTEVLLEAMSMTLIPGVWPSVLAALIAEGAKGAWLSPILMKKGRSARTLHVLASIERDDALQRVMIARTSTIGVLRIKVGKYALARRLIPVDIPGGAVQIKVASRMT